METCGEWDGIMQELDIIHCPFNWTEFNSTAVDIKRKDISELCEKIKDIGYGTWSSWHKFILCIVLCYEHYCKQDTSQSFICLKESEELLESVTSDETSRALFEHIKVACYHVVWACKTFLLYHMNNFEESRKILKEVIHFDSMDYSNKAALFGIRAAVLLEYGLTGREKALVYANIAVSLDSSQAEWHFVCGFCLQHLRHGKLWGAMPDDKEIDAFETAIKLKSSGTYKLYLAFSYLEKVLATDISLSKTGICSSLQEKAAKLFLEALKEEPDSVFVNLQCARGLILLPYSYKYINLAIRCCFSVLHIQPNNGEANYCLGIIYEDKKQKYDEAIECYSVAVRAKKSAACKRLYSLRYWQDETYDPSTDEDMNFQKTCGIPFIQAQAISQIGSFFLFVKNDIQESFKHFSTLFTEQESDKMLSAHVCSFLRTKWSMNMFHVLCDEARLALRECQEKEAEDFYKHVIATCMKHDPEAGKKPPVSYRKKVWMETVYAKSYKTKWTTRIARQKFIE